VCYDRLGKRAEAIKYNNKAAEYKPNSPAVIHNKIYFENLMD
jgi:Flp pilus assembly protein TadD